jgi:hypothetical protein
MKKQVSKIAFCGLVVALSMVFMALTFLPNFTYALPAIAGALLVIIVIEVDIKFAFVSYFCVLVLSVLLVPDKFSVLLYISFFGYYPILKALFEKKKGNVLLWVYKFLSFNAAVSVLFLLAVFVLNLKDNKLIEYAKSPFGIGLLLAGNIVFFMYDLALDNVIGFYLKRLSKLVRSSFK